MTLFYLLGGDTFLKSYLAALLKYFVADLKIKKKLCIFVDGHSEKFLTFLIILVFHLFQKLLTGPALVVAPVVPWKHSIFEKGAMVPLDF